jgi:hypothetical protein
MAVKDMGKGPTLKHPSSTAKSSPKMRALQRSASRSKAATRANLTNPQIVEAGVTNIPVAVARLVAALASRTGKQAPHGSLRAASQLSRAKKADAARAAKQARAASKPYKPSKPPSRADRREMREQMRATDAKIAAHKKKVELQRQKDLEASLRRTPTTFRGVKRYN